MNSGKAQSVVLTTGMIVFFLGWFSSAKNGKVVPPAKFIIGSGVVFLILEVLADVDPELGSALAVAIGTTACFHYGSALRSVADVADLPDTTNPAPKKTPVHVTKG
jgi:hypothetical protein